MSLNWDKLQKLRRDHAKPKFALNEVFRQLKKRPKDPYLLAWQADIGLRIGQDPSQPLDTVCKDPSLPSDAHLLDYIYCLYAEWHRQRPAPLSFSAGPAALKWENAAKSLTNRQARLQLWSDLFIAAIREELWEDVKTALRNAQKDGLEHSKPAFFANILAHSYLARCYSGLAQQTDNDLDKLKAKTYRDVALKFLKRVVASNPTSPDDPVGVENLGDLRFLSQVCCQVSAGPVLHLLSLQGPPRVKEMFFRHREDLLQLDIDMLRNIHDWAGLKFVCAKVINDALNETEKTACSTPLGYLETHIWRAFAGLYEACRYEETGLMAQVLPDEETEVSQTSNAQQLAERYIRVQGSFVFFTGRASQITGLAFHFWLQRARLEACNQYFAKHRGERRCFRDLRRFVSCLDAQSQKNFLVAATESTDGLIAGLGDNEETLPLWIEAELNALKFGFLLCISRCDIPDDAFVAEFIATAMRLSHICSRAQHDAYYEASYLATYTSVTRSQWLIDTSPVKAWRAVYQATVLIRAQLLRRDSVSFETGNEQPRHLLLYSIRLHALLGFTSLAFRQYPRLRVKEMMHDTVSHNLLNMISVIHPFETPGVNPDEELARVIHSIEKMESRVDSFLSTGIEEFKYEHAFDLLSLRRKLKTSFTKHICVVDRRRIARLKGKIVDEALDVDPDSFVGISDNRDFLSQFSPELFDAPDIGEVDLAGVGASYFPYGDQVIQFYRDHDQACSFVYKEPGYAYSQRLQMALRGLQRINPDPDQSEDQKDKQPNSKGKAPNYHAFNTDLRDLWLHVRTICEQVVKPNYNDGAMDLNTSLQILDVALTSFHSEMNNFVSKKSFRNRDEPTESALIYSQVLVYWYSFLELAQAMWSLTDRVEERRNEKKSSVPERQRVRQTTVKELRDSIQKLYSAIQDEAQRWVLFLKTHGMEIFKAATRDGVVGDIIMQLMTEEDIEYHARESLESLLDTLGCVKRVKLSR